MSGDFFARLVVGIAKAARNAELRREAADFRRRARPAEVVPAAATLPRAVVDVGGHDASEEGRR